MAATCTAMEVQDRRLSISKSSASKISKSSPVLKHLSSSSSPSSTSPPPSQLPSSITSSPSRPIARVVNTDPSSFRRVVQELTGTTLPSTTSASSQPSEAAPRAPSRLQRIAPPPLRSDVRGLQHHQTLLEQMQHQQASSHMLHLQSHHQKVGTLSTTLPFTEFGNPNPIQSIPQFGNPNPNLTQSLPMLSPHLLSPLPALTPGDNTWANPIEVISNSPKPILNTSNSLPPLLPLPNVSTGSFINGYGNALLPKPVHTGNSYTDAVLTRPIVSHGQTLPPLLSTPPLLHMSHTYSTNVLPPWSPSPFPFSPGLFPPSPGAGGGLPTATLSHVNTNLDAHMRYSSQSPNMPKNFTF